MNRKYKLTKESKSQQQKFFRLCSDEYRKKLIGKQVMTVKEFSDVMLILAYSGFDDYHSYLIQKFPELTEAYASLIENEVERDRELGEYRCQDEDDIILKKFCDGIKNKRVQEEYRFDFMI